MSFFERLKAAASTEWRAYTEHPFTDAMADGSLPGTTDAAYTLSSDILVFGPITVQ